MRLSVDPAKVAQRENPGRHLRKLKNNDRYGCGVSTARDICRYWTRAGA